MQKNKADFKAENSFLSSVLPYFLRKVFADSEGNEGDAPPAAPPALNFEDLVSKARKEEKDKIYPQLEEMKKQNKVLTKANNEHLLTIATFEEQVKNLNEQLAKAGKGDPQEVIDLKKSLDDALKLVDGLREELKNKPEGTTEEIRATIEEEIKKQYEVKLYRLQKIQEAGDEILIPDLVVGDTKEAVDASIAAAIEQAKVIKKKLGVDEGKKEGGDMDNPPPKKPKPNPLNPAGKGLDTLNDLDPNVIRTMSDEEYAEWRKKAGIGIRKK